MAERELSQKISIIFLFRFEKGIQGFVE